MQSYCIITYRRCSHIIQYETNVKLTIKVVSPQNRIYDHYNNRERSLRWKLAHIYKMSCFGLILLAATCRLEQHLSTVLQCYSFMSRTRVDLDAHSSECAELFLFTGEDGLPAQATFFFTVPTLSSDKKLQSLQCKKNQLHTNLRQCHGLH